MKPTLSRLPGGRYRATLPLPPSNNDWLKATASGGQRRSDNARAYMQGIGIQLVYLRKALERSRAGFQALASWAWVDVWVVMPKTSCDNHNYFKIAFDTLEEGGLVENDRYILPNLRGIGFDTAHPTIVLEWAA